MYYFSPSINNFSINSCFKLPVKFGQILKFSFDSLTITAIVLDFNEGEGGQWIGVCFIDQNRLFSR